MTGAQAEHQTRIDELTQWIEGARSLLKSTGVPPQGMADALIERESLIQQLINEQGIPHDLTTPEEELVENPPEQQSTPQEIALKLANSVYAQIDPTPTTDLELARIYAELALTQALNELTRALEASTALKPPKKPQPRKALA